MAGDGITKRPDGKWRARVYVDGKERSKHFRTKKEAQDWKAEQLTARNAGTWIDPRAGKVTFRAFAEDYRKTHPWGANTQVKVESILRNHCYPVIGDRPLSAIRPSTLQNMFAGITTLGPPAKLVALAFLRPIFAAAVADRIIPFNPCDGVKLAAGRQKQVDIPTTEQTRKVAEKMPEHLEAIVELVCSTGLRYSEFCGLEVDQVDFLRKTLYVGQQLGADGKSLMPPKTENAERVIPLSDTVLEKLSLHLAQFPVTPVEVMDKVSEDKRRHGPREAHLIFLDHGKPIRSGQWSGYWRAAADPVGLEKGEGVHALRHYFASALIGKGISVKTVQTLMGHSSPTITLNTYAHVWPDNVDEARAAIEAVRRAA